MPDGSSWWGGFGLFEDQTQQVAGLVLLTAAVDFVLRQVLGKLAKQAERTDNDWDDAIVFSVRGPASLLLWVLGVSVALGVARFELPPQLAGYVPSLRNLGVIVSVAWLLHRWIRRAAENLRARPSLAGRELEPATIQALQKLSTLAVWVITVITALQTLGFDLTAILTVGGIGGVAVGFAARDVVANFFGGLMVYIMQPFRAGDWIRSPDRDIEGTVEEIGWYQTRIRTFDKRPLYVPNAIFPSIAVENPSRMLHRRIKETVGVRYDDFSRLRPIIDDVRQMLREHPDIESDEQILMVNFDAYGASSLDFFIYTFTRTTDWATYHMVKQDVLLRVGEIIERHGAEVAFPTRTLHVPEIVRLARSGAPEPSGQE